MRQLLAGFLVLLLLSGCTAQAKGQKQVRITALSELPPTRKPATEQPALRMAVASMTSPEKAVRVYMELARYLEAKVGQPVELVQRRTYAETYDLLRSGAVDFAAVCTYVYVLGHQEFGLALLAAPVTHGSATYQSLIIARAGTSAQAFEELRGKRFAFTDPLSTTGRLYPVSLLKKLGTTPEAFFHANIYTYSHDNSILAVLDGVVDGAAVDSLIYENWTVGHADDAKRLQIVSASPVYGSPPFVLSPEVEPKVADALRSALLNMDQDEEGQRILASLGVERLIEPLDSDYDAVRELAKEVGGRP